MSALTGAWLRLFAVQASWNYERMLGLGVGVATQPLLRLVGARRGIEAEREAIGRAAQYFNAHPYLAGFAVGAQARAELDDVPGEDVERLRQALVAPLGSMGDRLVWAGWLPATIATALAVVALGGRWIAVVLFLAAYNVVHLWLRTWGLRAGWRLGLDVSSALAHPIVRRALRAAPAAAGLALGVALPLLATWGASFFAPSASWGLAAVAAVGFVILRWLAPALGGLRLALLALGLGLLGEAVWR